MKLSDKFQPAQLTATRWELYDQCSEAIGVILDNRFKDPHIKVYEHTRHTPIEVFKHRYVIDPARAPQVVDDPGLAKEEAEVLGALSTPEIGRRLNVIGDVGVGKTTFVKHLLDLHFGRSDFIQSNPIYIDFADFNALLDDPLAEIREKFVTAVWSALEKLFDQDFISKIDNELFKSAAIFAGDRSMVFRLPEDERASRITQALERGMQQHAVKFTFERLNQICADDINRLVLIFDNIDHLPEKTVQRLGSFLIEVQLVVKPMVIVAMRDHTFNSGFSAYDESRTVLSWHQRLNPPNLRLMLDRRVAHFFPQSETDGKNETVSVGAGVLRIERGLANVCRALLTSPFQKPETYEFICAYTNFNLRDLFTNLQRIVGFPGYRGYSKEFFESEHPQISVGIDECLISLALDRHLMFFPSKSAVFNPYSAGDDSSPMDQIVAARILQLLDNRIDWMKWTDLRKTLTKWGYGEDAVNAQVKAMVNKDIVWTSTGLPRNFGDDSGIRLSYRGQLYARKILRRTVFNYLMSFDVEAPNDSHAIYRHHKNEFLAELQDFSNFSSNFESDALAFRVLGLAEIIFSAEQMEIRNLKKRSSFDGFLQSVAPKSISVGIVDGLAKFLERVHEGNGNTSRFMPPTTKTLKEVGEIALKYRTAFQSAFPQ